MPLRSRPHQASLANAKRVNTRLEHVFYEAGCFVADNLPELEDNLSDEVRMSLVYISGNVSKSSVLEDEDTSFYFQMHGSYFLFLFHGSLIL